MRQHVIGLTSILRLGSRRMSRMDHGCCVLIGGKWELIMKHTDLVLAAWARGGNTEGQAVYGMKVVVNKVGTVGRVRACILVERL